MLLLLHQQVKGSIQRQVHGFVALVICTNPSCTVGAAVLKLPDVFIV